MTATRLKDRVSVDAAQALTRYLQILEKWNPTINLVSPKTLDAVWDRHFLDSAQVFFASGSSGGHWVDMGSGAGFPGLVIAILLKDNQKAGRVSLIEADRRKAAFLATVVRELDLPCTVLVERIEQATPQNADWLTARALAPLDVLLDHAVRHLGAAGCALFPKGRAYKAEIEDARKRWSFSVDAVQSQSDPDGVVLRITGLGKNE
jgi:16S rRNA (guanine527-N7)-methyltransferase